MELDDTLEKNLFARWKDMGNWAKILAITAIITGGISTLFKLTRILKARAAFPLIGPGLIAHLRILILYEPNAIIMPLILICMGFALLKVSKNCNEFSAGKFDSLDRIFGS